MFDSGFGLLATDALGQVDLVQALRRVLATAPGLAAQETLLAVEDLAEQGMPLPAEARGLLREGWRRQAVWCAGRAEADGPAVATLESPGDHRRSGTPATPLAEQVGLALEETPGPRAAERLEHVDPLAADNLSLAGLAEAWQRQQSWVAARLFATLAVLGPRSNTYSTWRVQEVGSVLKLGKGATERLLAQAQRLAEHMPATRDALASGRLTLPQAQVLIDELACLPDDLIGEAEARLVPIAEDLIPARLRTRVRAVVIELDPETAARRREVAREQTDVSFRAKPDATASLFAYGPVEQVLPIWHALCNHAETLPYLDPVSGERVPAGARRLAALHQLTTRDTSGTAAAPAAAEEREEQHEADGEKPASDDPPLAGRASRKHPRPVRLQVVVDLPTLLGLAERSATLVGYGPIDPELARALADDAEWYRWVTDPVSGHLLDDGDRRYVGSRLRRFNIARDGTCRAPVCQVPAHLCDQDHRCQHAKAGPTNAANTGSLCQPHNRTRHLAGWEITESAADGSLAWKTSLGRTVRMPASRPLPGMPPLPEPPPPENAPPPYQGRDLGADPPFRATGGSQ